MKHVQIQKPCTESWKQMNPTQRGAFCQKCSIEVIDFTDKSSDEIKTIFRSLAGQSICSRFSNQQLETLNVEFEKWSVLESKSSFQSMWVFSLIVVFGLTLFSCETEKDRKMIKQIQHTATRLVLKHSNTAAEKSILNDSKFETIQEIKMVEKIIDLQLPLELEGINISDSSVDYTLPYIDEEVEIQESEHYIMGDMIITQLYQTYLVETTEPIAYDINGIPIPTSFQAKVFPNPATIATALEIGVPINDLFEIRLFDIAGKEVQLIFQGELEKGSYRFPIELSEYPHGTYLVAVHSEKYKKTIRLIK